MLFSIFSWAESIRFVEEKYYEALESTFHKTGTVSFFKDSMLIQYDKDDTLLTYNGDTLIIQKGEEQEVLDLNKSIEVKIFFILFEAVYFENEKVLARYFEIEKQKKMIVLKPHRSISSYVEGVSYKKTDSKLDFLQIELRTADRIRIEELDEVP
ncbi:MAG: Unknown protein [uncultured Sulfurovum sp.]|uniref:Outer membrane lipoprotein carrier protein LolA n=1 Tax=uncultured Sulfurovum sp. TaxID=269237 RepID=A0A6S6TPP0_9BACT|nr:MAG: Unknown protein [uncultured Sulfurovum sp.]